MTGVQTCALPISIIVKSLDSLRKKQKWDCDIVLVNDNSKDDTGKVAEGLKKKYSKITVIHRKKGNNGMGFTLMEGSRKAKGDMII